MSKCHPVYITWSKDGYQCLNCGASANHSWNIKHELSTPRQQQLKLRKFRAATKKRLAKLPLALGE